MNVECNCGHVFKVEYIEAKEKGMSVQFVQCPECSVKKYTFAIDNNIKKLMARQKVTRPGQAKVKLANKIELEVNKLIEQLES